RGRGRVAVSPAGDGRWAVAGRGGTGELGGVETGGLGERREPVSGEPPLRPPAEDGQRGERLGRRGGHRGGVDDRGVRQHPTGGDVAFGGEPVAGLPQRPDGGQ